MGTTFRPYQPDQMLLLPQDLREWVPEPVNASETLLGIN